MTGEVNENNGRNSDMEEKVKDAESTNGGLLFIFCIVKYSPNLIIHILTYL